MRAPVLFSIIVMVHALAIGSVVMMNGCATRSGLASMPAASEERIVPMPPTQPLAPSAAAAYKPEIASASGVAPVQKLSSPRAASKNATRGDAYVIKSGDMLSKIAVAYGVSSKELVSLNRIKNPNALKVGQTIYLPAHASLKSGKSTGATSSAKATSLVGSAKTAPSITLKNGEKYTVRSGDSLSRIASRTGSSVSLIKKANNLTSDRINIGQALIVPKKGAALASTTTPEPTEAGTKPSHDLEKVEVISTAFGDGLDTKGSLIETSKTEVEVKPEQAKPETGMTPYTVQQGETLKQIATTFIVDLDELRTLNKLDATAEVKAGDRLIIPEMDF
jgi:LysM repeat protein